MFSKNIYRLQLRSMGDYVDILVQWTIGYSGTTYALPANSATLLWKMRVYSIDCAQYMGTAIVPKVK